MIKTLKDQWNANLYDQSHYFVSQYGTELLQLLAPQENEKILDLGCGTGDLARELKDLGTHVIGVDKSVNMIEQAKGKYAEISFKVKDATELGYKEEFDAVFSNATLHWVKHPEKALQCIFDSLKKGGRFVAEFGGKGNVQSITDEVILQIEAEGIKFRKEQFPWFYPSIAQYTGMMEAAGFRVTFAQHFDRPTKLEGEQGLKKWIEMFGGEIFNSVNEQQKRTIVSRVENNLKAILFHDGNWYADYKRIRVIGVKE
ncbi:class I SAM-dependent methyltransferase [Ureibacillus aquaedulcis]|uniref:Methyltransferase domain-containing protein n=1 Tax=Ureibacillus aquaedulcis TaxID=3058421 RepID=A0ABT8GLR4_9BACL|nr:class I SAM-dependent methyltransferase [Ureibacillus sp. BA0131]MDN4492354.1 methyltransferase domain-containing protein [Ureibacillus sp. BA0131]